MYKRQVVNDFKEGGAGFKNQNIHANLKFKDLEIKYIYNNYITDFTDSSDYYNDRFLNHSAEIKYTKKLSDKLSMIPRINVSYSEGYNTPDWETLRGVNRTQVSDNFKYDISETNFLDVYKRQRCDCKVRSEQKYQPHCRFKMCIRDSS